MTLGLVMACAPCRVVRADERVPTWLREATGQPDHASREHADYLVLLNQRDVVVDKSGRLTQATRYAIRVLTRAGREAAAWSASYLSGSSSVKRIRAWLIQPNGGVLTYGMEDVRDYSLTSFELYSDVRAKAIVASRDADIGSVFGFESLLEETPLVGQFEWFVQWREPVLQARLTVQAPEHWTVTGVTFNRAPLAPTFTRGTYVWDLRDLPVIDAEPESPPLTSAAARIGVTYRPDRGAAQGAPAFGGWDEVARWLLDLQASSAASSPALEEKARSLVAGARDERDSIGAIARYVQHVRYAAVELGLDRGGGYRPHDAADVFARSYGDCKDKANLLRVMLKSVGVRSYLVAVYAQDPGYVREEWPSPQQFNHCILAIEVRHGLPGDPIVSGAGGGAPLDLRPHGLQYPVRRASRLGAAVPGAHRGARRDVTDEAS